MKKVVLCAMGGTIACKIDKEKGGLIPVLSGSDLIEAIPELKNICSVEILNVGNDPSSRVTPNLILNLSKIINDKLNEEDLSGVVVTHGTDTLEETAYLLDLLIDSEKTVVVTGAMRSVDEIMSDGSFNILNSCRVAIDDKARNNGVLVVFNEFIHPANTVTKTHSSNVSTFQSPYWGPIGYVDIDKIVMKRKNINERKFNVNNLNKNCPLIKIYIDMDLSIFDFYIEKLSNFKTRDSIEDENKIDGLVLEAFGRGNLDEKIIPYIEKFIEKNIPVVIATRTFGRALNVYAYNGGGEHLKRIGAILAGEITAAKARLKLIAALSSNYSINEIRDLYN